MVDLPGTYSLTAYSIEEIVARDFLTRERPDVVVDVVDASNLERNLYLATQIMELGIPLILAFNMSDVADARGVEMDLDQLSALFGVRIMRTVGHKGKGMEALKNAIVAMLDEGTPPQPAKILYGREIERELAPIEEALAQERTPNSSPSPRWLAVKLLENDEAVRDNVRRTHADGGRVLAMADAAGGPAGRALRRRRGDAHRGPPLRVHLRRVPGGGQGHGGSPPYGLRSD